MKNQLLKTMLLLFALIAGSVSTWADEITYTFTNASWNATPANWTSGKAGGGFNNNGVQVTTTSTGANATSPISFNAISKIVVTYNTNKSAGAGSIEVKVGDNAAKTNTVGYSGSADGRSANFKTQFDFSPTQTGTVKLTVNTTTNSIYVCSIAITYTASSTPSSGVSFATSKPSIDWPTTLTYTQTATTADGYASTPGASVTYSIGATNTAGATINASTGEVTPTKGGNVIVVATAAAIDGQFTQSTDSYTLVVNDVRSTATLAWSENSVEIFKDASSYSLPTLNNPNSLPVTYSATGTTGLASVTSEGVVTVNTGIVGTATIKASFEGNMTYKPRTATYTIEVVDPTVKGSKYNPYTVAEVINGTATGSNIYVTGYIVGNYNATAPVNPADADSNFALADALDETNGVNTIPVELPKGTVRNNWGPQTNNVIGCNVLVKGNKETYFSVNGIKGTSEVTALSVSVKIAASGYSTLASAFNLDHLKATPAYELEAYVVTAVTASSASLASIPHIPANTGVILKGTAGTTYTIPVFEHGYTVGTNLLKAAVTATPVGANEVYVLKGGKFCKVTGASTVPAGKAYLLASDVSASELTLDFEGGATGINSIENGKLKVESSEVYDLQGRKVVNPTKGLYIVNGRKVVIK